jgi:transcriptional regulator with XRE-family HTH domain
MGFKQKVVAKKLGINNASMISRWETGLSMPSGINLLKLSKLYKTLVNELYWEFTKELESELYPDHLVKGNDP